MINLERNKLSLLISLSLAGAAAPALAQQAVDAGQLEEVSVMAQPIRDSQKAAIDAKRDADNTVDIISADTIGRFPDQNLADSLGRVPGLAIERDQGQARYINFRGAPFRYTSLAIDGLSIPGAENGRVPRFDSFPSVITSRIDSNKAIMADMPGSAVSGHINISTFDPFVKEGWAFSTDVGMGNQELGDGDIEKLALRTSWSNDNFGFSLFTSENSREQVTDNREYDIERTDSGEVLVNELDFRSYKVTREDRAYGGRFEFRGDGALERVFVSTLYNEFQDFEERNQIVFDFAGGAEAVGAPQATGAVAENQFALAGRALEYGLYENSTFTNTLGADFTLGDWHVESRLNFTETENNMFLPMPRSAGGFVMASFDVSDLLDPAVTGLFDPRAQAPIDVNEINYAVDLGMLIGTEMTIDATKFKLDAEREMQLFGQDAVVKTGFEMDAREADGFGMVFAYGGFPSDVNINDFATSEAWESQFSNGIAGATYYDNKGLRQAWSAAVGGLTLTPNDSQAIRLEEDITAGYAMVTTHYDWGNLVLGARVENTDYLSEGPTGNFEDSFTNVLPSAHLNVDLAEDVKLRMSVSTGVSRPTYAEWRGDDMVDFIQNSVSAGNPALEAEESIGADLSLEWYAGDASLLSAGLFSRSIDNVIYAQSDVIAGSAYLPEVGADYWVYTQYVNGSNGKMRGAEFNAIAQAADFLPALEGFGVSANLTLLDSEFETLDGTRHSLPGTSENIFNASVFYEMEGFSVRLNHQYRDDWLSTTENVGMNDYWAEQKRVDLSVSYDLPMDVFGAGVTLYANANNLTDEQDVRYTGDESNPNQVESYGRRYLAGFRMNF
ncbi:TonB-dependent receptor [Microbulbifer sp. CAU 1566]|uniref:TonB-dependent receptor n=1 Tax=Microbulbifer sp. CAU 1566 TaxID=2933269 RepID=UPI00200601EC|nr:TonB-dependent receptor [Microbulbifer sp. CAU 1566]MCK7596240.1 TonB-dependent receptor [Microbulbifer sp. CAU 1566]